jgi:hypothetical protein
MHVVTISMATVASRKQIGTLAPAKEVAIGVLKYSAAVGAYVAVAIATTSVAFRALCLSPPPPARNLEVIVLPLLIGYSL